MDPIFAALPQLADLVQKAGVVGVLIIFCGVLAYEIRRGRRREHDIRNELAGVYGQRDKALLMVVKLKTVCEANKIQVDLSDVRDLIDRLAPPVVLTAK